MSLNPLLRWMLMHPFEAYVMLALLLLSLLALMILRDFLPPYGNEKH